MSEPKWTPGPWRDAMKYAIVPVEPTEEMLEATNREWDGRMSFRSTGAWKAMLAARPSLPPEVVERVERSIATELCLRNYPPAERDAARQYINIGCYLDDAKGLARAALAAMEQGEDFDHISATGQSDDPR